MIRFLIFVLCFFFGNKALTQTSRLNFNDSTFVTIKALKAVGNDHLNDNVVFAESKIKIGQTLPILQLRDELLASQTNLMNTRLFNDVMVLIYQWTDDNEISIEFQVDERWYIWPAPILYLKGINFGEWRDDFDYNLNRLSYGIYVKDNNLSKQADELTLSVVRGFEQKYLFEYFYPALNKSRTWGLGIRGSLNKEKGTSLAVNDNDFESVLYDEFVVNTKKLGVAIQRRKQIRNRYSLELGYESKSVGDSILLFQPNYFPDNQDEIDFLSLKFNIRKEGRDLIEYPTEGHYFEFTGNYEGFSNSDWQRLYGILNVNAYHKIGEKFYTAAGFYGKLSPIQTDSFYELVSSRMPLKIKPRGFNKYQLFPASYFTVKSEFRYQAIDRKFYKVPVLPDRFKPVPFRVYPKLFLDFADTKPNIGDENNPLNDSFLISGGVGVDVVSLYNIPLRVELSLNNETDVALGFGINKAF